jgi:hypothetical protein
MADWITKPPLVPFTSPTDISWHDYFLKQQQFMQGFARLQDTQTWTGVNSFSDVTNFAALTNFGCCIDSGGILLSNQFYNTLLNVEFVTSNVVNASIGQGAAIYVQHKIDNTIATGPNVNSGIRSQVETSQRRSGTQTNDVVAGYFGVRNNGVDVGGFGIHVDAYSNGTGANTTMYGASAEMYRETNAGFTAGFHTRSIGEVGYFDNNYGFLASPGGSINTFKFGSIFAGGSAQTGNMQCDFGLDLAFATCATAAIRIGPGQSFRWDGVPGAILQQYDPAGEWQHWVSGVKQFGLENTGRLFVVSNANTFYPAAAGPSGNFLAIRVGGIVYKLQLFTF